MIKNDKFDLYHIYSIPIRQPDTLLYSTILPEHTYLATSTTRQQYVSTSSVDECITFGPKKRVCKDVPIYNYNSRPTCEMAVILDSTKEVPSSCEVSTFAANINTFQPLKDNKWIFILQRKTPCVLQCGETSTHHNLEGSGILKLEKGCKVYTTFVTLVASDEVTTNTSHPIVTVDIEDYCTSKIMLETPQEIIPLKLNNIRLDTLKALKEELNQYTEKLNKNKPTFFEAQKNKFSTVSYALGASLLAYILYKTCCCYNLIKCCITRRTHDREHNDGCIQIFNNCFTRSSRRQRQVVPLETVAHRRDTQCISDDDSGAGSPTNSQRLRTAQSLF